MRSALDQRVIALHDQAAHLRGAGVACQAILLQDRSDLRIEARCLRGANRAPRNCDDEQAAEGVHQGPSNSTGHFAY